MLTFEVDIHEVSNTLFFVVKHESAFDARDHLQSVRADTFVIAVPLYVDIATGETDKGFTALLTRGNILAVVRYFYVSPTESSLRELGSAYFTNAMFFSVVNGAFFFRDENLVA